MNCSPAKCDQDAAPSLTFVGLTDSGTFKYVLEQLATGNPNPKECRRLVREVRDTIKVCAETQIKHSAEHLSGRAWISPGDRLPAPYEEVRILFDGVPRIARLCHSREYFQLATFIDSTKSQYIARIDRVTGWMPLPLAPAALAGVIETDAITMLAERNRGAETAPVDDVKQAIKLLAASSIQMVMKAARHVAERGQLNDFSRVHLRGQLAGIALVAMDADAVNAASEELNVLIAKADGARHE